MKEFASMEAFASFLEFSLRALEDSYCGARKATGVTSHLPVMGIRMARNAILANKCFTRGNNLFRPTGSIG